MSDRLILVTGAARSGKSEWAEYLATQMTTQSARSVIYVATAQSDPADAEWQARIVQHQQRRSPDWQTQLVPIALAAAVRSAPADSCLLIDSLGTWLSNLLEQPESEWDATVTGLLSSLQASSSQIILVAEEVGWGVVPAYPIGRQFRDRLGKLTRRIGTVADVVYLVTAGHVLNLSRLGTVLPPELPKP